ncbi:hypothetical protein BJ684DRAFT_21851 [Piptocephalis cylindrospora]|uniref:SGNH hydrolase-type esterase domain-containing protein n=1 Tax=Piptocephalis cylindrospora TaxID=1907219 RepID=A0A4P9XZK1_9FUNG|nr:hypothetical protein BJ684DRAFT_21851 [Piptocephalis cylindrospora]|eukprot:RKP11572.1 hypothetical protein BJ684DRAFT_21851 [Piptocephalis cylindrospora]
MTRSSITPTVWDRLLIRLEVWVMSLMQWFIQSHVPHHMMEHGVCILGDDIAFGYGDRVIQAGHGVAGHLPGRLDRAKALHQEWCVYNRGRVGSKTTDWFPSSSTTAAASSKPPSLLDEMCSDPRVQASEIIYLFLGNNDQEDPNITAEDTVKAIQAVVRVLLELPWPVDTPQATHRAKRIIYVSTLPTAGDAMRWGPEGVQRNQERNTLLKTWLEGEQDKATGQSDVRIKPGPYIDLGNYEYDRADLYTSPFRTHLSRDGYVKVAKDFILLAEPDFVKCEFHVFTSSRGRT